MNFMPNYYNNDKCCEGQLYNYNNIDREKNWAHQYILDGSSNVCRTSQIKYRFYYGPAVISIFISHSCKVEQLVMYELTYRLDND